MGIPLFYQSLTSSYQDRGVTLVFFSEKSYYIDEGAYWGPGQVMAMFAFWWTEIDLESEVSIFQSSYATLLQKESSSLWFQLSW